MLTEAQVKRATKYYLDKKGYKEIDSRELHETGPDLKMRDRRNGRTITIEAKGVSDAKSGMENKIVTALGQSVARFHSHPNYFLGIAVPIEWKRRMLRKLNRDAMSALQIVLYFVREDGSVEEVSPRSYRRHAAA